MGKRKTPIIWVVRQSKVSESTEETLYINVSKRVGFVEQGVLLISLEGDSCEEVLRGLCAPAKILRVDVCLWFLVAGES